MRRFAVALTVLLVALPVAAKDEVEAAKKARNELVVLLTELAGEARSRHDITAAQAYAETVSFVAGVPHPHLDAIRRELVANDRDLAWPRRDLVYGVRWLPTLTHAHALARSPKDHDWIDAALVKGLPGAIGVTRRLSRIRVATGLKRMRYDAKRSTRNVAMAREKAVSSTTSDQPRQYFMLRGGLAQALREALTDVRFRAALFDPADKGITVGSWEDTEGQDVHVIGISGNRRVFSRAPRYVTYPPPGAAAVLPPVLRRSAVPLSVHVFDPEMPLREMKAVVTTEGPTKAPACTVSVRRIGLQRVVVIQPAAALSGTTYTATLFAGDERIVEWSFSTRLIR